LVGRASYDKFQRYIIILNKLSINKCKSNLLINNWHKKLQDISKLSKKEGIAYVKNITLYKYITVESDKAEYIKIKQKISTINNTGTLSTSTTQHFGSFIT
jgi:hypothetical protein